MSPRSRLTTGNEGGYSLIGLLLAVALLAIITNGAVMTLYQIHDVGSTRADHLVAIREAQNAGHWITLDGQIAADIETTADEDGFPLTLSWSDQLGDEHEVVYTLLPDNRLQREHYTNRATNPEPDATTYVALFMDPTGTSCSIDDDGELLVDITAAVGGDGVTHTETRSYRVFPRGSLQ